MYYKKGQISTTLTKCRLIVRFATGKKSELREYYDKMITLNWIWVESKLKGFYGIWRVFTGMR